MLTAPKITTALTTAPPANPVASVDEARLDAVCSTATSAPAGLLADAVGHERDQDDAGQPDPADPREAGELGQAGNRIAGDRRDDHSHEGERGRAEHEQPPGPSPDTP
jgi:hypothetical protein